ncbi:MAG: Trm112 family protein [Bacteroidia bacterium]|nr:Trm112 family protein [Bacteroidia bacterium]
MNVIPLLRCPAYGDSLTLSECGTKLISGNNCIYYPIIDEIPVLIKSEARSY